MRERVRERERERNNTPERTANIVAITSFSTSWRGCRLATDVHWRVRLLNPQELWSPYENHYWWMLNEQFCRKIIIRQIKTRGRFDDKTYDNMSIIWIPCPGSGFNTANNAAAMSSLSTCNEIDKKKSDIHRQTDRHKEKTSKRAKHKRYTNNI